MSFFFLKGDWSLKEILGQWGSIDTSDLYPVCTLTSTGSLHVVYCLLPIKTWHLDFRIDLLAQVFRKLSLFSSCSLCLSYLRNYPLSLTITSPLFSIWWKEVRSGEKKVRFLNQRPRFESWFCHLLATWSWTSFLTSPSLRLRL